MILLNNSRCRGLLDAGVDLVVKSINAAIADELGSRAHAISSAQKKDVENIIVDLVLAFAGARVDRVLDEWNTSPPEDGEARSQPVEQGSAS